MAAVSGVTGPYGKGMFDVIKAAALARPRQLVRGTMAILSRLFRSPPADVPVGRFEAYTANPDRIPATPTVADLVLKVVV